MDGATIGWMKKIARDSGITLCGSVIIEDAGNFYNRFLWVTSDGNVQTYDKRHLFRMADEHDHYSPGNALPFFNIGELTLAPQVCYDLRFPVWSRNTTDNPYDVLLYVANWPAARREQWLSLLKARAIENLCYVVAVNRIGRDGNDVTYAGDSCVIDFRGETLLNLADQDTIASIELDRQSLDDYRRQFPAYLDADRFSIDI
jgi:predicted amidohydrolase